MTKYLISFPATAMNIAAEDLAAVSHDSHAVIREAKRAGVYVFGGGINEAAGAVMVDRDGQVKNETYPESKNLNGGFCVLELATPEQAIAWAAKLAQACRCAQELREFGFDPDS